VHKDAGRHPAVMQQNLAHERETILFISAFPTVFLELQRLHGLFFIVAHSQLLRGALRQRHVHFVASIQPRIRSRVPVAISTIPRRIHFIRELKVMLDRDLAELYGVPTKVFNQAIKRNRDRFPADFMFQLTPPELRSLRSQFVTSNSSRGGRRYRPYAFTQEGVAMLSSVLKSERAVQVNIAVMRAFVSLREMATGYRNIARKLSELEKRCDTHDHHIKAVFDTLRKLIQAPEPARRPMGFVAAHGPTAV
jgi:ORF6N domain